MSDNEDAKFGLSVLTELKSCSVQDVMIACVDDLKGPPGAIVVEYPQTWIQSCLAHTVRNSLCYVAWKDYRGVTRDLKRVYQSLTEDQAFSELERFGRTWNGLYPQIAKSWTTHWPNLRTIYEYPPEIRKAIDTTKVVESLNSVNRAATHCRKIFPSDGSARKVIDLVIAQASKKWMMPIQNWRTAQHRFMIKFDDRLPDYQ
jgi:transposase-like protein